MSQKSMRKEPLADISNTGINVKKPLANIPIAKITTRVIRKRRVEKASGMHLQLKEMEINEMRTEQFPSSGGTVVQVWFKSP